MSESSVPEFAPKGIDLDYRPEAYWTLPETLLANVKGTVRRREIAKAIEAGRADQIPATIFAESLSGDVRAIAGQIHPRNMGGEYLPDYKDREVEIARIELDSATGDVISLRAAPDGCEIAYRIVDEYDTEYLLPITESKQPLTLDEVVFQFAEAESGGFEGLITTHWHYASEHSTPEDAVRFIRVDSVIYPQLSAYYDQLGVWWCADRRAAWDEDERDESSIYIDINDLRRRGWTESLIARFLGSPDRWKPVDHWLNWSGKRTWSLERVKNAEGEQDFSEAFEKSAKRRKLSSERVRMMIEARKNPGNEIHS